MQKIDPIYWIVRTILQPFFKTNLKKEEITFVNENIRKHRKILWITVIFTILTIHGLQSFTGDTTALITGLIAPVMIMGSAWFAISFGGIPAKLLDIAMSITFWMFLAFVLSLTTMMLTIGMITPIVIWPILLCIYIGIIIGCIQYDCADGLKVGLDESLLKHSRAALKYYQKQGIHPDEK